MQAPWVTDEMKNADLGDQRLNKRLNIILTDLAERPCASIPAASGGKSETAAAYRFFDNNKAVPESILDPHYQQTRQRIAAQKIAIFVADTTEVDLTRPQQQVVGAGPLDNGSRRGALVHVLEAFSEDGTPLGAVGSDMWTRSEPSTETTADAKAPHRKHLPIEAKESCRWRDSLRQARAEAEAAPDTQCIFVADSEADIYEVLVEPRGQVNPVDVIIRSCHDRAVENTDTDKAQDNATAQHLWGSVSNTEVLFTKEISVRGHQPKTACETRKRRQGRTARQTMVEVRATTVVLRPPWRPGDMKLGAVTINVVHVREISPPEGEAPVEWMLATTLPIDTIEDIKKIIQYYTVRWMIEIFFRVLKSGCRVEARRFEHVDRALTFVAVSLIVAWRVLMVCRLGRSCPDLDSEAIFEPSEWKSVYTAVHQRPAPEKPPGLGEMVRLIAQLSGYINTPGRKDPPGPQTLWLGMQRMSDLAWGWDTFGPGARSAEASGAVPAKRGRTKRFRHPPAMAKVV